MSIKISVNHQDIENYCKREPIRKLSLFGSVLRDDFNEESDVDVLVEFEPNHPVGFLRMAQMEIELSKIFGRRVDLRTPAELSRYFKAAVLAKALLQYAKE